MRTAHALALATLALPPAPVVSQAPGDVLRDADRAFFRDTRKNGLEGWLGWFAEDAVVFPPNGALVVGSEAIRRHYEGLASFPPAGFVWEPDVASISAAGDFGWTIGKWGNDSSGTPVWSGKYITVWRKDPGGAWRVVADCPHDPGYDKRMAGLIGPPRSHCREAERQFHSAAGDIEVTAGSWWAIDAESAECGGKFLEVWKRQSDRSLQLVADTGLLQAQR